MTTVATKRIHLIRHGQTDWNREKRVQGHSESSLTALGRQQASALGRALAGEAITAVYSSSSVRTRQTTELLFPGRDLPVSYCDRLREIYLGPWEGRLQADVRAQDPEQFEHFWTRPHLFALAEAETFGQVQQRAMQRFRELLETPHEELAVVSHGVLIKTILCALEPRPLSELWEPPAMLNCAHSIVEADGEQLRIVQYCKTA